MLPVTKEALHKRLADLEQSLAVHDQEITRLRNNRIATDGARQEVVRILGELEKAEAAPAVEEEEKVNKRLTLKKPEPARS